MMEWWIMSGMIVLAIASVLPAILRKSALTGLNGNELNVVVYKARLQELQGEVASGQLEPEAFANIAQELKQDLGHTLKLTPDRIPDVLPSSRFSQGFWAGLTLIFIPVLSFVLYGQLGTDWRQLQPVSQAEPQPQDITAMVAALAAKLAANPEAEPAAWSLLGKSYLVLKQYPQAVQAYSQAYRYQGDKADVLADYAEALALVNQQQFTPLAQQLLAKALALEPEHDKTHWLLGMAAFQNQQLGQAAAHWQKLAAKYPEDTLIQGYLAQLKVMSTTDPAANATTEPKTEPAIPAPGSPAGIAVTVSLDPTLATTLAPDTAVFILARAVSGVTMPLAVIRKTVQDLPVTVQLDDSLAMMPTLKLSSFPSIVVVARVAQAGTAQAQAGDWQAVSEPLEPTRQPTLHLTINQQIPLPPQ